MTGRLSRSGPVLRAFGRSAALRRSIGLVGVVVALLAFTWTASTAFVRSVDQRVGWSLGEADASVEGWRPVDIGHGPTTRERAALTHRHANGWIGLQGLFEDTAGNAVWYREGPWVDRPFPSRDTLIEGRWPTRAGEVAVSDATGASPGQRFVLDNEVVTFDVVGVVRSAESLKGRTLYASPGTWASLDASIIGRYPSMSTNPVAYWSGGGDPRETASAITESSFDPDQDPEVVTRSDLAVGHRSTLLTRQPLLYLGPSTLLLVGAGALLALFSGRWVRTHAPTFRAIGTPRSALASATAIANGVSAAASAVIGALVGIALALLLRPLMPQITGRELPNVSLPWAEAIRLAAIPTVAAVVVGLWTTRPERAQTNRATARRGGKVLTTLRRTLTVALSCAAILLVGPSAQDEVVRSLLVVIVALAWATLTPDVITATTGLLARLGPPADLAARKIRAQGGLVSTVALAICAASVVALSLATTLASQKAYAAAHYVPELPADRVMLQPLDESTVPAGVRRDFEHASGLHDPVVFRVPGFRNEPMGPLTSFRDAGEVERLLGHSLDEHQRSVLTRGGVLLPQAGPTTFTLDPDGRHWRPEDTATVPIAPALSPFVEAITLDRNLPDKALHAARTNLVYEAPTRADVDRAEAAPQLGRFDNGYLFTPRMPPTTKFPLWLTGASWLFALAVAAMAWVVARRISADLAPITTGLRAVGVPAAYTRQVAAAYIGHPLLTAIAWAILGAIVAVAVPALFVDNAMLVLTIPWPVVGSVVAASILATTAAAASASRSGQNAAHQPPTWQPRTAHRHRPPRLGVVGRDE